MKLWLTLMTAAGNEENLRELVTPILPFIDGIVAVVHRPCDNDAGLKFLEDNKGEGKIIVRDFVQRHDFSQTETLYAGVIKEGDLFIVCDTLERPVPSFIETVKGHINDFMLQHDLDCIYYYGKAYIVRYNELMHYRGSPHWGLAGVKSGIDFATFYPDDNLIRQNVRPVKRPDPFHFVGHYVKYYLYPAGSNHCLLGLEKNGDPNKLFPVREARRLEFRKELVKRGYPLTLDGVKQLIDDGLDKTMQEFFTSEKILNDAYRYFKLGLTNFKDDHNWEDMVEVL